MFHPSESIIITSDNKTNFKTKTKSKSLLSNALRQRASTWSATSEQKNSNNNARMRSKPKVKGIDVNRERDRDRERTEKTTPLNSAGSSLAFHRRQQSTSSQNSNSKLSIHSLDRDHNIHTVDFYHHAVNAAGVSAIYTGTGNGPGTRSRSAHNTPSSSSSRWTSSPSAFAHTPTSTTQMQMQMPATPTQNSHDGNATLTPTSTLTPLRISPPHVDGISREGLDDWLGASPAHSDTSHRLPLQSLLQSPDAIDTGDVDTISRLSIPSVSVRDDLDVNANVDAVTASSNINRNADGFGNDSPNVYANRPTLNPRSFFDVDDRDGHATAAAAAVNVSSSNSAGQIESYDNYLVSEGTSSNANANAQTRQRTRTPTGDIDSYDSITPRASGNAAYFKKISDAHLHIPGDMKGGASAVRRNEDGGAGMSTWSGSESIIEEEEYYHGQNDRGDNDHMNERQHEHMVEAGRDDIRIDVDTGVDMNEALNMGMNGYGQQHEPYRVMPQDRAELNDIGGGTNMNINTHGSNPFPPNINIATGPAHLHFNRKHAGTDESARTKISDLNDDHYTFYDDAMSIPQSHDTFDTPSSRSSGVRFMDEVEAQITAPTPGSYKRRPPASLIMDHIHANNNNANVHDDLDHGPNDRLGLMGSSASYYTPEGIGPGTEFGLDRDREYYGHDLEDPHDALMSSSMHGVKSDNKISQITLDNFEEKQHQQQRGGNAESSVVSQLRSSQRLRSMKGGNIQNGDPAGKSNQKDKGFLHRFFNGCWEHAPKPSWSRVSSAVVRHAPCFWCCFRRSKAGGTDRDTLIRLSFLCSIMALWQFGVGIFILIIFLSNSVVERNLDEGVPYRQYYKEALTPNLWMMSGSLLVLSVVGLVLFIATIVTIPMIRRVNLVGAIKYMWVLYWILPMQIFLVIALFDYHNVTDVWIKHWWGNPSMAWFRSTFCGLGTANTKCAVPYKGGANFEDEIMWCKELYDGDEDCLDIREKATALMSQSSYFFFYLNAIIGGALVVLLLLSLGLLEGIISAPIVQRSKETNIPLWLTLPIVGCFVVGMVLLFSPQSVMSNESGSSIYWIGVCYLLSMSTFSISALLGWFISSKTVLNTRDKKQKEIAIYIFIVMMFFTIIAVGAIFIASLVYSLDIVRVSLRDPRRGNIACYVDASDSCTNCCNLNPLAPEEICNESEPQCPEWTSRDVSRVIQTQLKQSATLAAIFFIYAFSALRFGFDLRRSQSKYQIAYV